MSSRENSYHTLSIRPSSAENHASENDVFLIFFFFRNTSSDGPISRRDFKTGNVFVRVNDDVVRNVNVQIPSRSTRVFDSVQTKDGKSHFHGDREVPGILGDARESTAPCNSTPSDETDLNRLADGRKKK